MTPLRAKMIKAMQMRGFSPRTHESYLAAVQGLARYYHRSPDTLGSADINRYFEYLVTERALAPASCRLHYNGIRFLYIQVLHWPQLDLEVPLPKRPQRIPQLLDRTEVGRILVACTDGRYRMMLALCYGCGLRLNELRLLKVADIDGERHTLRIRQGKGAKDRMVPLSPTLLEQLRAYWCLYHPRDWLFPGQLPGEPMSETCIQRAYHAAKARAGITKAGGIHSLRHAYATHQLEAGMAVYRLQHLLGHRHLSSTLHYVHWVPSAREGGGEHDLLATMAEVDDG